MPKFYNVPIYDEGDIVKWVEPEKAFEMSGWCYPTGHPMYEIRMDAIRPWREELHKLPVPKDNNNFSPCAISCGEMKAYVGEVKAVESSDPDKTAENKRNARIEIQKAREKINNWQLVGTPQYRFGRRVGSQWSNEAVESGSP